LRIGYALLRTWIAKWGLVSFRNSSDFHSAKKKEVGGESVWSEPEKARAGNPFCSGGLI
jgi:hypothetical protein